MEEEQPDEAAPAPTSVGNGGGDAETAAASSSSNSDSDSSDSELDRSSNLDDDAPSIEDLGQVLEEQPLNYKAHVEYIQRMQGVGDLEELRAAREDMNRNFPLTRMMWREWVKDEIPWITIDQSFGDIEKLFERAVQEYLSIDLWQDYLGFVGEHDQAVSQSSPAGIAKMRDLFERAITAGGLHVAEGGKLWAAFRKYETGILNAVVDGNEEEKAKQIQRIRTLFHRQLSVPLADMESTLAEYKSWEAEQGSQNDQGSDIDGVPSDVLSAYKKANDMYTERKQYEEQVTNIGASEDDKVQEFMRYIKFEESKGDPSRVQVLYERAVSDLPDSRFLWIRYASYADRTLKVPSVVRNVYHRATRNCPYLGVLWAEYLLALERIHASEEELKHVFEQAAQCSFATITEYFFLFVTRVDSLRRRMSCGLDFQLIRETFMAAAELLSPHLEAGKLFLLYSYWAKLECSLGKDVAAARKVWEDALKKSGSALKIWKHYISMEIEMGNINEARSLYKRCYRRRLDDSGSQVMIYDWIRFECEYGTLEGLDLALDKAVELKEISSSETQGEAENDTYSEPSNEGNDCSHKRKSSKTTNKQEPLQREGNKMHRKAAPCHPVSKDQMHKL